jgi:glucokinase
MKYAIGIDLGGTHIKAVVVNENGDVLDRQSRPTNDLRGNGSAPEVPVWAREVKEVVALLQDRAGSFASFIGLCAPGLQAQNGRSIAFMPGRMDGLEGLDWTTFLAQASPVYVLNDAQAALLGEVWKGSAKGCRNAFLLTLGTGVGGAIFCDGRLLHGQIGRAGHLGHICLEADEVQDSVGIPGSLEDAIAERTVSRRSKFASSKELVEAMLAGQSDARKVWQRSVYKLACGIASLINVLDPEVVVIGGGIAKAGAELFVPLAKHLDAFEWRPGGHCVKVVPATLGEWAGAFGAAYNAIEQTPANAAPLPVPQFASVLS